MANLAEKHGVLLRSEASFSDSGTWNELAGKHVTRFNMPDWDEPCSVEQMGRWLDRLNISKDEYTVYTGTDFEDWMAFNPDWPLRAFVGVLLEFIDTRLTV